MNLLLSSCLCTPHSSDQADLLEISLLKTWKSLKGSTNSTLQLLHGCMLEKVLSLLQWKLL